MIPYGSERLLKSGLSNRKHLEPVSPITFEMESKKVKPQELQEVVSIGDKQVPVSYSFKVMLVLLDCILLGSQPVLVHMSKNSKGGYSYNPLVINLLVEITKTVFGYCMLVYHRYHSGTYVRTSTFLYWSGRNFVDDIRHNKLLIVPAFLYAVNNSLKFQMQLYFPPTTFKMLGNLKIFTIAVLMRFVLKRHFNLFQYEALFLLVAGITVNQLSNCPKGLSHSSLSHSSSLSHFSSLNLEGIVSGAIPSLPAMACTLATITVPAAASVYNEFALKKHMDTSVHQQNFFLYFFGICFNVVFLVVNCLWNGQVGGMGGMGGGIGEAAHGGAGKGSIHGSGSSMAAAAMAAAAKGGSGGVGSGISKGLFDGISPVVYGVVISNAAQGILSSFFYKYADTILKKYSSTIATIVTAVASWVLFSHPLTINFTIGVSIVLISMHQFFTLGDGKQNHHHNHHHRNWHGGHHLHRGHDGLKEGKQKDDDDDNINKISNDIVASNYRSKSGHHHSNDGSHGNSLIGSDSKVSNGNNFNGLYYHRNQQHLQHHEQNKMDLPTNYQLPHLPNHVVNSHSNNNNSNNSSNSNNNNSNSSNSSSDSNNKNSHIDSNIGKGAINNNGNNNNMEKLYVYAVDNEINNNSDSAVSRGKMVQHFPALEFDHVMGFSSSNLASNCIGNQVDSLSTTMEKYTEGFNPNKSPRSAVSPDSRSNNKRFVADNVSGRNATGGGNKSGAAGRGGSDGKPLVINLNNNLNSISNSVNNDNVDDNIILGKASSKYALNHTNLIINKKNRKKSGGSTSSSGNSSDSAGDNDDAAADVAYALEEIDDGAVPGAHDASGRAQHQKHKYSLPY